MALCCYFSGKVDKIQNIQCNSGSVDKAMTMLNIIFLPRGPCHIDVLIIENVESVPCYSVFHLTLKIESSCGKQGAVIDHTVP